MATFVSYAQNFEDVMLWRALRHVADGFYVDVGAQHPLRDSVTQAFYERGWRGINIEPVSAWHGLLEVGRPEDTNLQAVIGSEPGEAVFYEIENTGLSTMDSRLAATHAEQGMSVRMSVLPMRTLNSVLSEFRAMGDIHFLKIDVEGAEESVLRGLSLDRYRPWIILLEATLPNTQIDVSDSWSPLLTGAGYEQVYFDGLNRYYLATENRELREHFQTPPNFFDNFVRHSDWERGELARRLGEEIDVVRGNERELAENLERAIDELNAARVQHEAAQLQLRDEHARTMFMAQEEHALELSSLREEQDRFVEVTSKQQQEQALELSRMQGERDELAHAGRALREQSEEDRREMQEVRRKLTEQLEDSRRQVGVASEQMEALRIEKSRADALLAYRARTINMLFRSRSWRITAPLRWASSLVGAAREIEAPPPDQSQPAGKCEGYAGVPDEATLLALANVARLPATVRAPDQVSPEIHDGNESTVRLDTLIRELQGLLRPPQDLPLRMRSLPGMRWVTGPILRVYERLFRKQTLFNTRLLEALEALRNGKH